ncbi:MAG: hypothetical protein FWB90_00680 [Fibromonadales bacterium]|nr:hypothetical protein [Fibromonadales bacterium]
MSPKEHDIKRRASLKAKKQEKAGNAISVEQQRIFANYRKVETCMNCAKSTSCSMLSKDSCICDLWEGSK